MATPGNVRKGWGKYCSRACSACANGLAGTSGFNLFSLERHREILVLAADARRASPTCQKPVHRHARHIYQASAAKRVARMRSLWPEHPSAESARRRLRAAVKRGDIIRPSRCDDCGRASAKIDAHHVDYRNPLDVLWLCRSCHFRRHYLTASPLASMPVSTTDCQ